MHIACTREASADTLSLVRILLEHHANPNAVCNGQTPLSLAIACGNESLVYLLLDYQRTDPSTPLGLGNGNALCSVLSTIYEPRWPYAKRIELVDLRTNETYSSISILDRTSDSKKSKSSLSDSIRSKEHIRLCG